MRCGIVARCDDTGLGNQTRNLVYMLKPDKVLVIDSSPFNKSEQHFDWYDGFNVDKVLGYPTIDQYNAWFQGLTHVLTAETFLNDYAVNKAMRLGIKTYIQVNAEFYSHVSTPPTKFLMPSYWYLSDYEDRYPGQVKYLPPPLFPNDFKEARETNFNRTDPPRFLHIVGKWASKDRNGTQSLLESMKYTNSMFELVVKSQYPLDFTLPDKRITWEIGNTENQTDLYKDFDAMILPRRYGGLCLPANEALMSGLPVLMTDISPNNSVLPEQWLVPAQVHDKLQTRIMLDVYNVDAQELANRIDWLCETNLSKQKATAFEIGMEYAADNLRPKYLEILV